MNDASAFDFGSRFQSLPERLRGERAARLAQRPHILSFGVRYLDAALRGIFPNDLILLGAKMGHGKTALATLIAASSAAAGRHVHYFALEAEEVEIERRMKYHVLSELMHRPESRDRIQLARMNYLDWYAGDLDDMTGPFEEEADSILCGKYATLHTLYRAHDFDGAQLEKQLLSIQDETSLAVIDHLHYVDTDDESENRGYKRIAKTIRDTALTMHKPVVVVAHIRKAERRLAKLIPDVEDFHGTSDVPKIVTKAVMVAWAFDQPNAENYLWNTYIAVGKCRPEGSRTRYVAMVAYDSRKDAYVDEFTLGRIISTPKGEKFVAIEKEKLPHWARNGSTPPDDTPPPPKQTIWYGDGEDK